MGTLTAPRKWVRTCSSKRWQRTPTGNEQQLGRLLGMPEPLCHHRPWDRAAVTRGGTGGSCECRSPDTRDRRTRPARLRAAPAPAPARPGHLSMRGRGGTRDPQPANGALPPLRRRLSLALAFSLPRARGGARGGRAVAGRWRAARRVAGPACRW